MFSFSSPTRNRPPSPVSDTEVDKVNKHELKSAELMAKDEGEWKWGELPDVAQKQAALAESEQGKAIIDPKISLGSIFYLS